MLLCWASGSRHTPLGIARSSWRLGASGSGSFTHNVSIPANALAKVFDPYARCKRGRQADVGAAGIQNGDGARDGDCEWYRLPGSRSQVRRVQLRVGLVSVMDICSFKVVALLGCRSRSREIRIWGSCRGSLSGSGEHWFVAARWWAVTRFPGYPDRYSMGSYTAWRH